MDPEKGTNRKKKELNSPLLDLFWLPVAVVVPPVWPFEVLAYVV